MTQPFRQTCEALAELQGLPGYPFVVVAHPITSLSPDEIRARADLATPYVEALLVEGVPWPEPMGESEGAGTLGDVVEALAPGLRSDGADLTAELTGEEEVTFKLHIPDQACADCIMPAGVLLPIFTREVATAMGASWRVRLDDPREGSVPQEAHMEAGGG